MVYGYSFYDTEEWMITSEFIKKLYGRSCMKCGETRGEMHSDHIIPRSIKDYLALDPRNLQVLCKRCNMEKGNTNQIDYRTEKQKELLEDELMINIPNNYVAKRRLQAWVNKVLLNASEEDLSEFLLVTEKLGILLHEP